MALARGRGTRAPPGPALFLLGRVVRRSGQHAPGHGAAPGEPDHSTRAGRSARHRRVLRRAGRGGRPRGEPAEAARLLGAADGLRAAIGAPLPPRGALAREQLVAGLRRRLGPRYDDLHAEGAALPLDAAAPASHSERATRARRAPREADAASPRATARPAPSPALLSPREREVSALVARGLSNRDIAATLVVTEGSAANYVQRILTKLGFRSRAQIAVWAAQQGLVEQPEPDRA